MSPHIVVQLGQQTLAVAPDPVIPAILGLVALVIRVIVVEVPGLVVVVDDLELVLVFVLVSLVALAIFFVRFGRLGYRLSGKAIASVMSSRTDSNSAHLGTRLARDLYLILLLLCCGSTGLLLRYVCRCILWRRVNLLVGDCPIARSRKQGEESASSANGSQRGAQAKAPPGRAPTVLCGRRSHD